MKEIIVIENRDLVNHYKNSFNSNVKLVSIPETWEELEEMCRCLNNKIKDIQVVLYKKHISIQWENDDNTNIDTYDDGTMFVENHLVTDRLTPAQMWQIIKSLVEE